MRPLPKRLSVIVCAMAALLLNGYARLADHPIATNELASGYLGVATNGPAVCREFRLTMTNVVQLSPDLPIKDKIRTNIFARTNVEFIRFLPESLNHHLWTNFIAHTNGRTALVWSTRTHPPGWPAKPPVVKWNRQSLIWGLKGMTALSPCWESEYAPGQIPITALTPRHGYTRGHSMGPDGFHATFAGKKVWFVSGDDKLVTVTVKREVVRTAAGGKQDDYTILLFDRDLPRSIQPLRAVDWVDSWKRLGFKKVSYGSVPTPMFMTEQGGNVSANVPGLTVPTGKGGDSGSPNMFAFPGELVFYGGRTTSGPSPAMQADMDELCRLEGLNPAKYKMQWFDISGFPAY